LRIYILHGTEKEREERRRAKCRELDGRPMGNPIWSKL
jgi:hypothetical protein